MKRGLARSRLVVIFTVCYFVIGSVFGRMLPYYLHTTYQWLVIGLLGAYLVFFVTERMLSRRLRYYIHAYFVIQTVIPFFLFFAIPSFDGPQDYFVILIVPLCIQAMWHLPQRLGTYWVGFFAVSAAASMIVYYRFYEDSWEGIGYGLAHVALCILVSVFSSVTRRAEEARSESQRLLAELQVANRKLQEYSRQVEELAAAEERNRLARELHDSVSQTIFSMTLTAQAARILLDRDPRQVALQLDHLQSLAQSALAEMRGLIQHLHPHSAVEKGLAAALYRHAAERRAQDGLAVEVYVTGERRLPARVEQDLFRLVQEALNNVVKHARVDRACVTLVLDRNPISLCVEDHGVGFEAERLHPSPGHLGLASMAERARSLGAVLEIDSAPGAGTRIRVENIVVEEGEDARGA